MKDIVIGIDVGGTNTVFGFIDSNGKSYGQGRVLTQKQEIFENYIDDLVYAINKCLESNDEDLNVIGVGIGAPNADYRTGTIISGANLRWKGKLNLAKQIEEKLKVPVKVTNDANAAALGEKIFGGAKEMSDFIVITLGTGLGSGFVTNGNLLYGHDGFAGEVGHIIVRPDGRECACGRRGCLETYVSATGVKRTAYKMLAKYIGESSLRNVSFKDLTSKIVAEAAHKGDRLAIEVFAYTGRILGEALANVVTITSPKTIFLFGGLAKAGDLLFNPTRKALEKNMLFLYKNKVRLQASELGDDAAILGASALIWNEYGVS